jgi:hypothetical protein
MYSRGTAAFVNDTHAHAKTFPNLRETRQGVSGFGTRTPAAPYQNTFRLGWNAAMPPLSYVMFKSLRY